MEQNIEQRVCHIIHNSYFIRLTQLMQFETRKQILCHTKSVASDICAAQR